MRVRQLAIPAVCFALAATAPSASAQIFPLPGANVVVEDSGQEMYYRNETTWKLTNYVSLEGQLATWSVTLQRQGTSPNRLAVHGFVRIRNRGNMAAPLGNIVVNLQQKVGSEWISAAADIADATHGHDADHASFVQGATRESMALNETLGPGNYHVEGARGTFVETTGSGSLNLTDADTNTVFSMVPQRTLEPGAVINLLYTAEFNNSVLGIAEGAELRPEVLVSFGNAVARYGNGSTALAIDINGNHVVDAEETRVRTARSEDLHVLPVLQRNHDSVTLDDMDVITDMKTTGTLTFSNVQTNIGGGTGTETTSVTIARTVSAELGGCSNLIDGPHRRAWGGVITNEAHISSPGSTITVHGREIDITSGQPYYSYEFEGRTNLDQRWCDTADVSPLGNGWPMCVACSFTQGGWGATPNGHNPAALLDENFATVYPSGVEIGIPGGGGFSMIFTSAAAISAYLPAGGPPSILNSDLIDPLSSSAGVFGGQVLALQLNIDFAAAGLPHDDDQDISVLTLCNTGTSLDGMTFAQILAAANTVLGGGALPAGFTVSTLNDLITDLNEAFDNCNPNSWTQDHVCRGD